MNNEAIETRVRKTRPDTVIKCYAARDTQLLGEHYIRHVEAMGVEGLHSKSAIAAELAHRDRKIERLQDKLRHVQRYADTIAEAGCIRAILSEDNVDRV